MGFLSNWYTKPGPGIPKDAPKKKGIALFFDILKREFFELIKLNLLFLVFCIPLVTIPAAICAMNKVLLAMVQDENHFLFHDFLEAFKANWKQASFGGYLLTLGIFASLFGLRFYFGGIGSSVLFYVPVSISFLVLILMVVMGFYFYPMVALIELPLKQLLKNAALLTLVCLPHNFAALGAVAVISIGILLTFPFSTVLSVFIQFALVNLISCFCAFAGLQKYVIRGDQPAEQA